jgi:hypothetical protein
VEADDLVAEQPFADLVMTVVTYPTLFAGPAMLQSGKTSTKGGTL